MPIAETCTSPGTPAGRWVCSAGAHRLLCIVATTLLCFVGCGKPGIDRLDVRGTVTYGGEPVPYGEVRFEPNASKGNSGPIGFTTISEGKFDTRVEDKGPVPGAVRVIITGYESGKPFAPALFTRHRIEVDITEDANDLNFDVPTGS